MERVSGRVGGGLCFKENNGKHHVGRQGPGPPSGIVEYGLILARCLLVDSLVLKRSWGLQVLTQPDTAGLEAGASALSGKNCDALGLPGLSPSPGIQRVELRAGHPYDHKTNL